MKKYLPLILGVLLIFVSVNLFLYLLDSIKSGKDAEKRDIFRLVNIAAQYGCLSAAEDFNIRGSHTRYCENIGLKAENLIRKDNP